MFPSRVAARKRGGAWQLLECRPAVPKAESTFCMYIPCKTLRR